MYIILELDCGSQISILGDGTVFLPDLSGEDPISIEVIEQVMAKVRQLDDFEQGKYVLATEHNKVVSELKQKLKKAKGRK